MKLISALIIIAVIAARLGAQVAVEPPAGSSGTKNADVDYAAFESLTKAGPPAPMKEMGAEKYLTWVDTQRQAVKAAALAFHAAHPADPRRWDVVMMAVNAPPLFIQSFGPDVATRGAAAIVADEAAKAEWTQRAEALRQGLLDSTDAAPPLREQLEWGLFAKDFRATTAAKRNGQPYDYSGFRPRFEAHAAKYPGLPVVAARASDYLGALEGNLPGAAIVEWRRYLESPHADLRAAALKKVSALDALAKPVEMAFTAADGREVDLAKLRGKVVLVDFWATWCGPCIAELPNVKKVYAAYHDKGFEIVGIALENGKLAPNDTPGQTAEKLAAAKKILTDFTAQNDMPWPQYFDGKYWKNDISTRFDITGIPAMFLLDQEGRIVSTNARGETLETEVKRLLKL